MGHEAIEAFARGLMSALLPSHPTSKPEETPPVVRVEDVQRAVENYLGPLLAQQTPGATGDVFSPPGYEVDGRPEYYDDAVASAEARAAAATTPIDFVDSPMPPGYYDPNTGAEGSEKSWMTPRPPTP